MTFLWPRSSGRAKPQSLGQWAEWAGSIELFGCPKGPSSLGCPSWARLAAITLALGSGFLLFC